MRGSTGPQSRRIGRSSITLLACALLVAASDRPAAISTGLVISQVYGGGGNSGAPYTHDFVEIFNRSAGPVSLAGLSIQYASATGTGNFGAGAAQSASLPPVSVAPGSYFLVQLAGGAAGVPLPSPDYVDADGPINMSATAGKVALVTGTATLGCNGGSAVCAAEQLARIIDLVGFGGANFFELAAAPQPSNATAIVRTAGNTDADNNASDFVVATPAPRTGGGTTGPPTLSIDDVSISEGDAMTTLRFTVSLSGPAASDVFYAIATEDETASAGLDYQALSLAGQVIPAGALSAAHDVTVVGDSVPEASETFAVRLTDVVGATPGDVVGRGTITNDDVAFTPIPELQGNGATSPFANTDVATAGIVTARKTNGFFLQLPDGEGDGQPETSDAIFVFTSTLPAAAVGDEVRVTGRLVEFRGTGATTDGTLTEITGPSLTVLSSGHALPAALDLAALLASPTTVASRAAQLERFEGMLVATASMDVVGPSNTFGELFAVVSGVPRTFREPGLDVSAPLPAGAPAGAPRFDGNFERLILDSDDLVDAAGVRRPRLNLPVATVAEPVRVLNVAGPLDYAFDAYRVVLDTTASAAGIRLPQPVPARTANEFTVASLNLENFRDGTANFASRTQKAARIIDEVLRTPDVLGLIEVGDQADLEAVAALVNAATGAAYQAYLMDGDGQTTGFEQNVGYLVNDARIEVLSTYQIYQGKTFAFAGQTDLLHDRPPFVLEARVRLSGTPFTAVLNHLRSLIDVSSNEPIGSTGLTVGERVREKRRLQAEDLADFVAAHIADNLVVLGDMNAFEFNDGLVDVLGTIAGSPAPASEVTAPSVDRWTHELVNLATLLPAGERYSYVFEGTAQVLDHVLVNQPMRQRLTRFTYARNNTDFPEGFESDFTVTTRLSDHDGAVAYFGSGTESRGDGNGARVSRGRCAISPARDRDERGRNRGRRARRGDPAARAGLADVDGARRMELHDERRDGDVRRGADGQPGQRPARHRHDRGVHGAGWIVVRSSSDDRLRHAGHEPRQRQRGHGGVGHQREAGDLRCVGQPIASAAAAASDGAGDRGLLRGRYVRCGHDQSSRHERRAGHRARAGARRADVAGLGRREHAPGAVARRALPVRQRPRLHRDHHRHRRRRRSDEPGADRDRGTLGPRQVSASRCVSCV